MWVSSRVSEGDPWDVCAEPAVSGTGSIVHAEPSKVAARRWCVSASV